MRTILVDVLHVFVILMMVVFVIGGILAATGTFDHWGERYNLKRRRRRLLRQRNGKVNVTEHINRQTNLDDHTKKMSASASQKNSTTYNGRYA